MKNFLNNRNGNVALTMAVVALPVLGAVGAAVDYTRASNVRSFAQAQADAAALSGALNGESALEHARATIGERHAIDGLVVNGTWLSDVDFRVDVEGRVPVTVLGAVPFFPQEIPISTSATVRVAEPRMVYNPPTVSELDYDAGDYNRVYVYCFYPEKVTGNGNGNYKHARTDMVPIADNGGTVYEFEMPRCDAGGYMSYKLLNVRLARTQPHLWDDPSATRFEFFTDTQWNDQNVEQYDIKCEGKHCNNEPAQGWNVLETVLCDTKEECVPASQGGIIPEGRDREPQRANKPCEPGKYMYYGWEDRPPGMSGPSDHWTDIAWTDRDYDDIRVVIGCPSLEAQGERSVRLTN
jgi:hypothetical protein